MCMVIDAHLRELVVQSRAILHDAPGTDVCLERARLVTEAYRTHEGEPIALTRAYAFAHVLAHMTLDLQTNAVFAGNMSSRPRAWMLTPEYGFTVPSQAAVEHPEYVGLLDGDAVPPDIRAFWRDGFVREGNGIGHLGLDNQAILRRGLLAVIGDLEAANATDSDPDRRVCREAGVVGCRAVIAWAARYADAAERAAAGAGAVRAPWFRRIASACRRVPAEPARDLHEALQSLLLIYLAVHIEGHGYSVSPGLLDRDLAPFARDGEDLTGLAAAFMLALAANPLWGRHSKTQCITLGAPDADPVLSRAFLEAIPLAGMPDPHVFLRWREGMDPGVRDLAMDLLAAGRAMPMLVHDAPTIAGLINGGVAPGDAAEYLVIGCNEIGVPGKLIYDGLDLNSPALLRRVVLDAARDAVSEMDALLARLEAAVEAHIRDALARHATNLREVMAHAPTPFTSAVMTGGPARGRDLRVAMPYTHLNLTEKGFPNTVNALAALATLVYEEHRASLTDVALALERDFQGDQALYCALRAAPKWGSGDPCADGWARAWIDLRERARRRVVADLGEPRLVSHLTRSLHHVQGRALGATADGRHAGAPYADSIGAETGTAHAGPTAMLASVAAMDAPTCWNAGYNLNLTVPAGMSSAMLRALAEGYFARGGQELQVNALAPDVLRDAQEHPQAYADLIVRVAGLCARFIDLSREHQDELIGRAVATGTPRTRDEGERDGILGD